MIPIKQIPELEWDYDLYTAVAVAQMFAKTVVTLRGLRLLGMLYSNISEEYGYYILHKSGFNNGSNHVEFIVN